MEAEHLEVGLDSKEFAICMFNQFRAGPMAPINFL